MPWPTPRETWVAVSTPAAVSARAASARLANGTIGSWSPCTSSTGGREAISAGQRLGLEQPPGEADDAGEAAPRRRSPTCSAIIVPWLKPTSTVRSGGDLAAPRRRARRRAGAKAAAAEAARHRLGRAVEPGDRKPLVSHRIVGAALAARSAPGSGCSAGAAPAARRARSGRCRRRRSRAGRPRGCRRSRRRRAARGRSGWSWQAGHAGLAIGVPRVLGATIRTGPQAAGATTTAGPPRDRLVHTFEALIAQYGVAALFLTDDARDARRAAARRERAHRRLRRRGARASSTSAPWWSPPSSPRCSATTSAT